MLDIFSIRESERREKNDGRAMMETFGARAAFSLCFRKAT
jgi:hypothetical protein